MQEIPINQSEKFKLLVENVSIRKKNITEESTNCKYKNSFKAILIINNMSNNFNEIQLLVNHIKQESKSM